MDGVDNLQIVGKEIKKRLILRLKVSKNEIKVAEVRHLPHLLVHLLRVPLLVTQVAMIGGKRVIIIHQRKEINTIVKTKVM